MEFESKSAPCERVELIQTKEEIRTRQEAQSKAVRKLAVANYKIAKGGEEEVGEFGRGNGESPDRMSVS
jgi:hypothetical protein